ncbi:GH25 family lysozyme [Lacticaseibacillus absianus]|uniref:GH25 family lysozyme n=1 Tax=Lacticaseibacillus absianus TaxID=2729623 RepID=UPI0015CD1D42|nr:GH25 family lysozyme [Lacticaseibacillus absianus]
MGSELSRAALADMIDETGSTTTKHILRMPTSLDETLANDWLAVAKVTAAADQAATGRAQEIIQVAASSWVDTIKIGDPARPRVDVVDVASYQDWMTQKDFNELYASGVRAAVVKTTQKTNYTNPAAKQQIQYAKAAGLKVSVYHYAQFGSLSSAKAEATYAAAALAQLGLPKSTPVVADIEENDTVTGDVRTNLNAFWQVLSAAGYTNHLVYTGGGYTKNADVIATVGKKATWWAQYPYTPSSSSLWNTDYGAWQFSSTAQLPSQFGQSGGRLIDASIDYAGLFTGVTAPEGPRITDDRYVTLTEINNTLWADFDWTPKQSTNAVLNRTYHSIAKYEHANGSTYLRLVDAQGNDMGLINEKAVSIAAGAQGVWLSHASYATITMANTSLWADFTWNVKASSNQHLGQTVKINGMYHHFNGSTYYSLWAADGTWLGYGHSAVVALEGDSQGQGQPVDDGRYVTIAKSNTPVWSSFDWELKSGSDLYQRTFLAKQQYHHANGQTYLSLYDAEDIWQGYVSERDVQIASGPQGVWLNKSGYATLTRTGRPLYSDFSGQATGASTPLLSNTYQINGEYHTFDGRTYDSLYDLKGQWIGYMDPADFEAGTNPQGVWQSQTGYATVTLKGTSLWRNFEWQPAMRTDAVLGQTFKLNGKYHHANGSTYYSLWRADGSWLGYAHAGAVQLNATPQGNPINDGRYITITSRQPTLWSDFDWQVKSTSQTLYHQTLLSKRLYKHLNGKTYLSLYDAADNWVGYIDEAATQAAAGPQGIWLYQAGYATLTKANKPIYRDFSGQAASTSTSHLGRTYRINGQYHLFNGMWVLSLYDGQGQWKGYMNVEDVETTANAQGVWQSQGGYATISLKGTSIWKDFGWHSSTSTTAVYGQQFRVNGKYRHVNGSTYYSLWRLDGTWLGYVHSGALKLTSTR